jgi:hypothetical protein
MRTVLLLGICLVITSIVFAQRECASSTYIDQQKSADPSFAAKINDIENFVQRQKVSRELGQVMPEVITIPVVVHVLYKTAAQNISDEQIRTQIIALNNDFRRKNADTVNTPQRFKALAADVMIEFQLAITDPQGRATTGIIRKATDISRWGSDDKIKFSSRGGDDAWDSHSYLNIWVGDLAGLLGYSTTPGAAMEKDGVVINYIAFGTIGVAAPYELGRTTTHEVGHWFGLKHVWGDSYCGDDLVEDTPKQGNFTAGCPTSFVSSCNNGTMGDMYMNYMDFTNDACMNLFTTGQKQRMLSLFKDGGPRNSLLYSKGLSQPWNTELPIEITTNNSLKISPNPTNGSITLRFGYDESWTGKTISIININGMVVSKVQVTSNNQRLDVSQLKAGMYFIQGQNGNQKLSEKFIRL